MMALILQKLKLSLVGKVLASLDFEKISPKVVSGPDSVKQCGEIAKRLGVSKALIVTDSVLLGLGLVNPVIESLENSGIDVVLYDGVLPDPTREQVQDGAKKFQDNACDGVIAIGGGSTIDCAKIIGACVKNDINMASLTGFSVAKKGLPPFIAIPTTHGTGSEATFAAIITDMKEKRKQLIADLHLIPKVAILDPNLVTNLPPPITAATGMDALTHAVESYISPWATEASKSCSERVVVNVFKYLTRCYHNGKSDQEAREAMLKASFDGGRAINIGGVGYVHAIAHVLGAHFHTPHGEANAMVLPHVLEFYGHAAVPPLARLAVLCDLGDETEKPTVLARKFIQKVKDMVQEMNMATKVDGLGHSDVNTIAKFALQEAHGTRHSILLNFGSFMKDSGYPSVKHMTQDACERIVSNFVSIGRSRL